MQRRALLFGILGPVALGVGLLGAAAGARADGWERDHRRPVVSYDAESLKQWLPASAVIERLSGQGYTNVTEMEVERGLYEVKAMDADGRRIELLVNPVTGDVIGFERD